MAGRPFSQQLFKEYNSEGQYSLAEWHDRFVEIADPTEYKPAIELAGSWEFWCQLKRNWPYFRNEILVMWLEEVDIKLRSNAILAMVEQSQDEKGTQAAKWLAEGRYTKRGPGKPSKAEVEREAKIAAGVKDATQEEIARVIPFVVKDASN